jgi:hypothetical protein
LRCRQPGRFSALAVLQMPRGRRSPDDRGTTRMIGLFRAANAFLDGLVAILPSPVLIARPSVHGSFHGLTLSHRVPLSFDKINHLTTRITRLDQSEFPPLGLAASPRLGSRPQPPVATTCGEVGEICLAERKRYGSLHSPTNRCRLAIEHSELDVASCEGPGPLSFPDHSPVTRDHPEVEPDFALA